jgi:hypothetical protein
MAKKFITYNGTIVGDSGLTLLSVETPDPTTFSDTTSFEFDGVDDYLQNSSTFDTLDSNTQFSISVWVKVNSLQQGFIFHSSNPAGTGVQVYMFMRSNGRIDVFSAGSSSNWTRSTTNLAAGSWYHIVMTLDQTIPSRYNMQKIYINGIEGDTSNYFGGNMGAGNILNIGRNFTSASYLDGLINELAIWSSHPLSQTEINEIYDNGPSDLTKVNTPPTSWYRSENATWNGSQWTMTDEVGNGTDLTSTNMVEANRTTDVPQ